MARRKRATSVVLPTYHEEARLLGEGRSLVAGLDEVGRGPLAGPVVAGVAILPPHPKGDWVGLIRDSKQLSAAQREGALAELRQVAWALETGACSAGEIDRIGIVPATYLAMRRAIDSLALRPGFVIVDALTLPELDIPQKAIVRGDASCLSVAAASIVAKVTRDRMMETQDAAHPGYGFSRNKGYGTRRHLERLKALGPCPIHRYTFAPVRALAQAGPLQSNIGHRADVAAAVQAKTAGRTSDAGRLLVPKLL